MMLFLAGGITGNLKPFWTAFMKLYIAGTASRMYCVEHAMNVFLAAANSANPAPNWNDFIKLKTDPIDTNENMELYLAAIQGKKKGFVISDGMYQEKRLYILESFVYIDDTTTKLIPHFKGFLLDSGAFTFMQQTGGGVTDWEGYVTRYAEYINQNNIEHFFELDIDVLVGIKKVEELRKRLERLTGKRPIPVWHKSRGKDYFIGMAKDYKYISIGGIVTREISRSEHKFFPWFIDKAHEAGAKIHGLGYTNLIGLQKYKFDSVDSTSWLYGNRGGFVYRFNGETMETIQAKSGKGLKSREAAIHNFNEWVKFQDYAEKNL